MRPDNLPHYVDQHVGRRMRDLRRRQHISQEDLAAALGLTFQQVQKYEKGANRVSASKLFQAAAALHTTINYFFDGMVTPEECSPGQIELTPHPPHHVLVTDEGREVDALMTGMTRNSRRLLLEFSRALNEKQSSATTSRARPAGASET